MLFPLVVVFQWYMRYEKYSTPLKTYIYYTKKLKGNNFLKIFYNLFFFYFLEKKSLKNIYILGLK